MKLLQYLEDFKVGVLKKRKQLRILYLQYKYNQNQLNKVTENLAYYKSKVVKLHPLEDLIPGHSVITPKGIGIVHKRFPVRGPKVFKGKMIEVWLPGKYYKAFNIKEVYKFYLYNQLLDMFFPLLPSDYVYIFQENDVVEYRFTDKGHCSLSDFEKVKREWITIFTTKRNGLSILKELSGKNLLNKIIKI